MFAPHLPGSPEWFMFHRRSRLRRLSTPNLIVNNGFETNIDGLVERAAASINPVRDTDVFHSGVASVRQDLTSGVADGIYFSVTAITTAGGQYSAGAWIRRGVYTGNNPSISLWDDVSGHSGGNLVTVTEEWRRSIFTKTFSASSSDRRLYIIFLNGNGNGTDGGSVWADDVVLNAGPVLIP